ncbi:MAG: hypothetical protein ACYC6J_02445 [Coriobacteriia bacterium]
MAMLDAARRPARGAGAALRSAVALVAAVTLTFAAPLTALAAYPPGFPPGYDPAKRPPNYNPYLLISEENWRAGTSMSQAEIQTFLELHNSVLKDYSCAEGGPNGLHSKVVKPASQIIAEAAQYWNVNPKLIIATLQKEQSLITQARHTGKDVDPASAHSHSTEYHLTNAMGAGVWAGSLDKHPGFGDQVWTGAQKLGQTTGPYAWYPGKIRTRIGNDHDGGKHIEIVPQNQPTWNLYTYTPYFPQFNVWRFYNQWFGDPLAYPGKAPVYRFYNLKNGSHFYTRSETERYVVATKWPSVYRFEGPAYSLETTHPANSAPLYRFYNKRTGSHFYTASETEKQTVISRWSASYTFEGVAYNVSLTPENCVPVYRFYNVRSRSHFYTISEAERDLVISRWPSVYSFEGIGYYVALSR